MPLGKGLREILAVVSICAAMLGIAYLRTYSATRSDAVFGEPWDHHKYIYMAQHKPLDFHIAPFSWRFLNPLLASLLPFDVDTDFLVLTLIELALVGVMVYLMLKAAGFGQITALTGLLFYWGLTQAVKGPLYMVWLSDPLTHLILVTAAYLILTRRPAWASVLLAVGCCAKEVVILAAPLYYLLTAERILDWKRLRAGILFALPPVAVYLGIRVLIPEWGSDPGYTSKLPAEVATAYNGGLGFGYWESAKYVIASKLKISLGWQLRALTVNTFGLLILLPLFAIRENRITALRWGPFFAAVYASMLLFSGSYERPLVICFPGVLIMALNGVERLRALAGASPWWPVALATALIPVNWIYPKRVDPLFEVQALIFIVFLAAILHGRKDRLARI
jgi:hypothetical protein